MRSLSPGNALETLRKMQNLPVPSVLGTNISGRAGFWLLVDQSIIKVNFNMSVYFFEKKPENSSVRCRYCALFQSTQCFS